MALLKDVNCVVLTDYDFQHGSNSLANVSSRASFCICAHLGVQRSELPTRNPCMHFFVHFDDCVPLCQIQSTNNVLSERLPPNVLPCLRGLNVAVSSPNPSEPLLMVSSGKPLLRLTSDYSKSFHEQFDRWLTAFGFMCLVILKAAPEDSHGGRMEECHPCSDRLCAWVSNKQFSKTFSLFH